MSIPRKGIRKVEVDDIIYEWTVRKKPTYSQAVSQATMTLAVQLAEEDRPCVLVANLKVTRPDNWIEPHQTAVTPREVRALIGKALDAGWSPSAGGNFSFEHGIIKHRA